MTAFLHIICIDVGSPAKIGWADDAGRIGSGLDMGEALDRAAALVAQGQPVAVGFEAPIWTPRRAELARITGRRGGIETTYNRAWSAGAGTGALGAALALMPWTFARLRSVAGDCAVTVDLERFRDGSVPLFVWEAFVSGIGKGASHHDDALLAVKAFAARWPDLESDVLPEPALNHAISAAAASGLCTDSSELGMPAIVVGVRPVTVLEPIKA
ncbi:hypothetical protein [uncultured Bosea sp.]|uniref:hypothetical protein n=1 Tax=uncultured Bosea sp. TaxID=211457 RepID=UPI0025E94B34|nr:hypothetical protein [uncultured Bosea sp.]